MWINCLSEKKLQRILISKESLTNQPKCKGSKFYKSNRQVRKPAARAPLVSTSVHTREQTPHQRRDTLLPPHSSPPKSDIKLCERNVAKSKGGKKELNPNRPNPAPEHPPPPPPSPAATASAARCPKPSPVLRTPSTAVPQAATAARVWERSPAAGCPVSDLDLDLRPCRAG